MLPSPNEISPTSGLDLDEQCALQHFLGLDHAAALEMFRRDSDFLHVYLEDLVHMGEPAFNYYVVSLLQYLDELPDDRFADEAPEIADYLLIRFPTSDPLTATMNHFIGEVDTRLRGISHEIMPSLPHRFANSLATYQGAK